MQDQTIRELIAESHATALLKGWWGENGDADRPVLEQLMLMVSELSEACEAWRDGNGVDTVWYDPERAVTTADGTVLPKPEGFMSELADVYIRIGDTIGRYGLIEEFLTILREKQRYNMARPYRHGNKQA